MFASSSEVAEEKAAGQIRIHGLTAMTYRKQSNAIDRTWCQDIRKIHLFLCLFLSQRSLLHYVINVISTEEYRETTVVDSLNNILSMLLTRPS